MKKFLLIPLFLGVISLSACGSDDDGDNGGGGGGTPTTSSLTVSPTNISASSAGGSFTVNVKASGEWTAFVESGSDWISTSTSGSASKEGTVTVTVKKNTDTSSRNGTVIVKCGTSRMNVSVTQAAPLQVSDVKIYLPSVGGSKTVTVIGTNWNATTDESWITTAKNGNTLTITVSQNDAMSNRTGSVVVSDGNSAAEVTVIQSSAEDRTINTPEGYHLVWHDEFNEGTQLNSSDWTHEVKNSGWVNNELQNYRQGAIDGTYTTELVDGHLNINCFKGNDGKVYSGRVYAHVNSGWEYGYFEARIKLPAGKGTWPAFWMMPVGNDWNTNPWPMCGEIDIMEEVGCVPNEVSSSVHTQDYNHTKGTQKTHAMTIADAEGAYHTYALEWTADAITTYVDGKVQLAVTKKAMGSGHNQWPFHYAFYPIINLAWGGAWGGMNGVDENALPLTMEVDYIRVFQKD